MRLTDDDYAATSTTGSPPTTRSSAARYPGEPAPAGSRCTPSTSRPTQVTAGSGATLWRAATRLQAMDAHAPFPARPRAEQVRAQAAPREPIEDLRIDFEDGYGVRDDDAGGRGGQRPPRRSIAADGPRPPFVGMRIKSLEAATRRRALRTLDLFLTSYHGHLRLMHAAQGERPGPGRGDGRALRKARDGRTGWPPARCASRSRSSCRPAVLGADGTATVARLITAGRRPLHRPALRHVRLQRRGRGRGGLPVDGASGRRPRQGGDAGGRRADRRPALRRLDQRPAGRRTRRRCTRPGRCTTGWSAAPWSAASTRAGTCTRRSCRPGTRPPTRSSRDGRGRGGHPAAPLSGPRSESGIARRAGHGPRAGRVPAARPGLRRAATSTTGCRLRPGWSRSGAGRVRRSADRRADRGAPTLDRCVSPVASGRHCRTGERPAAVVVSGGRIVAVEAYDDGGRRRPRRPTSATWRCCPGLVDTHVHVNEPGPHRVGGVRHRHPGRGGRRGHHDRGHAAEQPAADGRPPTRCGSSGRRPPGSATSTSASGAARSPATPPTCPACTTPGCSASRRSSPTPACPSSRRSARRPSWPRRWPRWTRCSWCTPRTRTTCTPRASVAGVRRLPRLPAARGRARRGRDRDRRRPAHRRAGAHPAPVGGDALPLIAAARADGVRVTAETCPHYLTLDAAASRPAPPSSSAARRSATRRTPTGSGPPWPTA